ncbi:MAG: hypothetical protein WCE49_10000 [Terrimicrobiaceae bacterium]
MRHGGAQGFQPLDGFAAIVTAHSIVGDQPGDGPSVPGGDDGFPPLNIIEELGWILASEACISPIFQPVVSTFALLFKRGAMRDLRSRRPKTHSIYDGRTNIISTKPEDCSRGAP